MRSLRLPPPSDSLAHALAQLSQKRSAKTAWDGLSAPHRTWGGLDALPLALSIGWYGCCHVQEEHRKSRGDSSNPSGGSMKKQRAGDTTSLKDGREQKGEGGQFAG